MIFCPLHTRKGTSDGALVLEDVLVAVVFAPVPQDCMVGPVGDGGLSVAFRPSEVDVPDLGLAGVGGVRHPSKWWSGS